MSSHFTTERLTPIGTGTQRRGRSQRDQSEQVHTLPEGHQAQQWTAPSSAPRFPTTGAPPQGHSHECVTWWGHVSHQPPKEGG